MLEIALLVLALSLFVLSWVIHRTTKKKIAARHKSGHVLIHPTMAPHLRAQQPQADRRHA